MNAQEHLLTKLAEECSEVAQNATKALCFGLDDKYGDRPTNRERIVEELNDLFAVVDMLVDTGILPSDWLHLPSVLKKKAKVCHFMGYAQNVGTLQLPLGLKGLELPTTNSEQIDTKLIV